MIHLKLFEGYFKDKYDELCKEIKSEIDVYLYSITDEFQITSEMDEIKVGRRGGFVDGRILLNYTNISVDGKDWNFFLEKCIRISKSLERNFDCTLYLSADYSPRLKRPEKYLTENILFKRNTVKKIGVMIQIDTNLNVHDIPNR